MRGVSCSVSPIQSIFTSRLPSEVRDMQELDMTTTTKIITRIVGCVEAALAALALGSAPAQADAPHVGQPCNDPSRVVSTGLNLGGDPVVDGGMYLVCAGTQWELLGPGVLTTSEVETTGDPCGVSVANRAIGVDSPYVAHLVMCYRGKWTPFRP
jgi:hypothetical protein